MKTELELSEMYWKNPEYNERMSWLAFKKLSAILSESSSSTYKNQIGDNHYEVTDKIESKGEIMYTNFHVESKEVKTYSESSYKVKLESLLEGLEAQHIDKFMSEAKIEDFLNYGKAYLQACKDKVNNAKSHRIEEIGGSIAGFDFAISELKRLTILR